MWLKRLESAGCLFENITLREEETGLRPYAITPGQRVRIKIPGHLRLPFEALEITDRQVQILAPHPHRDLLSDYLQSRLRSLNLAAWRQIRADIARLPAQTQKLLRHYGLEPLLASKYDHVLVSRFLENDCTLTGYRLFFTPLFGTFAKGRKRGLTLSQAGGDVVLEGEGHPGVLGIDTPDDALSLLSRSLLSPCGKVYSMKIGGFRFNGKKHAIFRHLGNTSPMPMPHGFDGHVLDAFELTASAEEEELLRLVRRMNLHHARRLLKALGASRSEGADLLRRLFAQRQKILETLL